MILISIIIGFLWIVLLIYWLLSAVKSKQNFRNYNWRQEVIVRVAIIFVVVLFLHIPILHQIAINIDTKSFYANYYISLIGFIIFMCGFALAVWARFSIGKNWGMPMTIKDKPELVTSGPYAFIRHPIYSGIIFAMLGTALAVNSFWIVPLLIITIYFIYSSIVEEKNMHKLFPHYEKYKKQTKALIPFIY